MELIQLLHIAVENKPKLGDACNHCGYCCLSEICSVGQELTGQVYGRCELLITDGDKHTCKLAENEAMVDMMGFNTGCCAETQQEVIERLTS